jgi:two-component system chemotaxis response regulator CheY
MPDINGYELINFIKNHDKYKKIPIIFVSTERGEKDIEKGLSLGAVDYLTKPFKSEELQSIIRNTLNL